MKHPSLHSALWIISTLLLAGSLQTFSGLPDSTGQLHELEQYKGRIVVLEWINFDCPFVKKQYDSGRMQELQRTYTAKNVVWLTMQATASNRRGYLGQEAMLAKRGEVNSAATAVLRDEQAVWAKQFKISKVPSVVILNAEQQVVYEGAVDDTPGFLAEEAKTAHSYIQEALDLLLNGKTPPAKMRPPYGCSLKLANP